MGKLGFPIKTADLAVSVKQIAKDMNIDSPFKEGLPGRSWMKLFLKRHRDISIREPEK